MKRDRRVMMHDNPSQEQVPVGPDPNTPVGSESPVPRTRRAAPTAVALAIGLAALSAQASETDLVRDIQRYCTVCWRNARLDPRLWDDCTQEVCCRLLTKARSGQLDLTQVLAEDTPERRELVRAIDMVRKRVQRTKRFKPLDGFTTPASNLDERQRNQIELGEILESARRAVLSRRQDRIIELWMRGWSVPEIGTELNLPLTRVSDEKYKALRKLEQHLRNHREELEFGLPSLAMG
ncbi:MAG TPA: sigma-70 family RNA polymerase sigma factor [Isosphaeraceae bacterium]|nr:sigma-70 family RNA polymerase sigma factor [Isosphaeraceae bacterium]